MQPRNARMRDVAELAGVATMTVSRVLNNSAPVTKLTRERVNRAIGKLKYLPNPVARSLRQSKSNAIGIIVPNFYDPFFASCAHAISVVAKKYNYSISATISDEDASVEFAEAALMMRNNVEGIAVIPAANGQSRLNRPEFDSTHIVTIDRPIRGNRFNSVLVENRKGAALAVSHLIGHGHKAISYLGLSERLYTIKSRYAGYAEAMRAAGLTPQAPTNCQTEEDTVLFIEQVMSKPHPPTAFFASNNLLMRYALHAFSSMRIRIPADIALVGFDDFELADIMSPALTVIRQSTQEMGRIAGELLFSRLAEKDGSLPGKQIVLPVQLIVRQSCGCNPGEIPKFPN